MAMKRTKTPWMKAEDFGRSLPTGIGINLLVPEIAPMEAFCRDVLGAAIVYADEDFAAVTLLGSVFMLHADHSYQDNPDGRRGRRLRAARNRHRDPHLRASIRMSPKRGRENMATMCSPASSTSRTACANAISSGRASMSSCPVWRSAADGKIKLPGIIEIFLP